MSLVPFVVSHRSIQPTPRAPTHRPKYGQRLSGGVECSACSKPAVTRLDYAGRSLCRSHFTRLVERRAQQDLRDQLEDLGYPDGARIGVGLSGGKDSASLTALLVEAVGPDPRFEIVPISVDEGIPGYRDQALEAARELTDRLDLELTVVSHEEDHGVSTQEVAERTGRQPCATCGVFRRSSLNQAAREAGCDVLATGHNLDDHAETTLMNLLRADLEQVLRTAPHEAAPDGLIPRITPLVSSTEQEVALYAVLADLPFHGAECPHAEDATRRTYRSLILDLLDEEPSARHRLASLSEKLKDRVEPVDGGGPGTCQACGEPASGDLCRACELAAALPDPSEA